MFGILSSKSKKRKSTKSPKKKSPKMKSPKKIKIFQLTSIPKKKKYNNNRAILIEQKLESNKKISKKESKEWLSYWIHENLYKYVFLNSSLTAWFETNYSANKITDKCLVGLGRGFYSDDFIKYIDIREKIRDIDMKIENYAGKGVPPEYALEFVNLLLKELGLFSIMCPGL